MSHAALVSGVLFWLVVLMTLLLVLFVYAVVVARPEGDVPAEASALESLAVVPVARTPPAPAPALPVRRPKAPVPPAGDAGQAGSTGYAARHAPAAVPVISPPKVAAGPPRRPVGALILVFAGLAIAVVGGWLLLGTGRGAAACSHQVAAICSQGFVVLTGTQVLGGAFILAGLALFFTALYRAFALAARAGGSRSLMPRPVPHRPAARLRVAERCHMPPPGPGLMLPLTGPGHPSCPSAGYMVNRQPGNLQPVGEAVIYRRRRGTG